MLGLTPLGTFHTAISLIAVGAGLVAFIRDKQINPHNLLGRIYVITTVILIGATPQVRALRARPVQEA